ncbi:MAG: hypothetical protein M3N47_01170 [Chloroflexota bacterium]|nr:hypothetical protein [Chloroflexota bacterium]
MAAHLRFWLMGVIYKYTCNDCGYAAEVDEGVGFVISSESGSAHDERRRRGHRERAQQERPATAGRHPD